MAYSQDSNCQNPIVLVHGLWNTVGIFARLIPYLESQGRTVHAFNLIPNNGDVGIEALAQQLQDSIDHTLGDYEIFDLLGFSMGGLVSRFYLQKLGGLHRVKHFVTVSTPHYGTTMAFFRWNPGGRQMRPGSQFLRALNQDIQMLQKTTLTSLWTPLDLLVVPASSCCLPIGQSKKLWISSHNNMLSHELSLKTIGQALSS